MELFSLGIFTVCSIVGMAAVIFTPFGTLIIFCGAALYAFLTGLSVLTITHLVILFALYLFGEVLENIFVIIGAKKFGASNWSIAGGIVGGFIGAVAGAGFFGIGIFFGTLVGIFIGSFLFELFFQRDFLKSLKAGAGGIAGRFGSIAAKLLIGAAMVYFSAAQMMANP